MKGKKLSTTKYFIGIDVSKATFNYCLRYGGGEVLNGKVSNNIEFITEFVSALKNVPGFRLTNALFVLEFTGIYSMILITTLTRLKANVVVKPAMRIKNSLGIIRGKDDR